MVFSDRRTPQLSGDEVLASIRDRGLDCPVATVTAVPPNVDTLETPFDDYLTKPVSRDDLVGVADRLSRRSAYDRTVQEYVSPTSKRVALEVEKRPESLETNEECAALLDGD